MECFLRDCTTAGIAVPIDYRVPRGESVGVRHTFASTHDGIYAAIARAARDLRREPTQKLLDEQVIPSSLRAQYAGDVATQTLIDLLNPPTNIATSANDCRLRLQSGIVAGIGACTLVEHNFGLAFAQMQRPGERLASTLPPFGYEFVTDRGRVVAVGKGYGEPAVLSLQPISINGHEYPPGTIMRADTETTKGRSIGIGEDTEASLAYSTISQVPLQSITQAGAMRLTGFAFEPGERRTDFEIPLQRTTELTSELVHDATIGDLHAIAQAAFRDAFRLAT